jgi:hypothetical protein
VLPNTFPHDYDTNQDTANDHNLMMFTVMAREDIRRAMQSKGYAGQREDEVVGDLQARLETIRSNAVNPLKQKLKLGHSGAAAGPRPEWAAAEQ